MMVEEIFDTDIDAYVPERYMQMKMWMEHDRSPVFYSSYYSLATSHCNCRCFNRIATRS
jgi:hypothetical protein